MRKIIFSKVFASILLIVSFVLLPSCVTKAASAEPSYAPIIEIKDYSVDGGMLTPGGEVTINLTLHNTSGTLTASDILMTVSSSSNMIYPVYGTDNQTYVGSIEPGASQTVAIRVNINSAFNLKAVDLKCDFDYQTSGTRLSNSATIAIPATGANIVGVSSITVASHAVVGGKSLISINYTNQSNINITDAKLVIEGNVLSAYKEIQVDTIYSNKSYLEDYFVCFSEAGNQTISVFLKYTGIDGEECIDELGTFDVVVSNENVVENSSNFQLIVSLIGKLLCVVAGFVVFVSIILYAKRR